MSYTSVLSKLQLLMVCLAALCVSTAQAAPKPVIFGAEPDLLNKTMLITGDNFGNATFTGTVILFVPTIGETNLVVTAYSQANQELLVQLPNTLTNFGGSYLLTVYRTGMSTPSDPFETTVGPFSWLTGTNGVVTTRKVGIGTLTPATALEVSGTVTATSFAGGGAGLTGIDAGNITTGTLADGRLSANVAQLSGNQTFTGNNSFLNPTNLFSGLFSGSGSGLTGLNASELTSGTVDDARLSSNIPRLNSLFQTFSGQNNFFHPSNQISGVFDGNGTSITHLRADQLATGAVPGGRLGGTYSNALNFPNPANSFAGDGSALTGLNASELAGGTVPDARLSGNVAQLNGNQWFTGSNIFFGSSNLFSGSFSGNGSAILNLDANNLASGTLPSARLTGVYSNAVQLLNVSNVFAGDGSGLTGIVASNLSGSISESQLPANVAKLNANQAFTGFNNFAFASNQFRGLFFGNGSSVSNLNAANISAGTLADARLSSNVARLNTNQVFFGLNTFVNASNVFTGTFIGNGSQISGISFSNLTGTLSESQLPTNLVQLGANQTFTGANTFSNPGNSFTGNGGALSNLNAFNLTSGILPQGRLSGVYSNQLTLTNSFNILFGRGSNITTLNASNLTFGTVADARLSSNIPRLGSNQTFTAANTFSNPGNNFTGNFSGPGTNLTGLWRLSGNVGTTAGVQFIGTADNQPLEIKVNSERALRIEPNATSVNIIGGNAANFANAGAEGGVISGGGSSSTPNQVYGAHATIGGGNGNTADSGGTVPGGIGNLAAGLGAFAAGQNAQANYPGTFVWGDGTAATAPSATNEFVARASGGVTFYSDNAGAGVTLAPGSGAWSALSDRNSKENVKAIDGREVLERLSNLPLATWNYKSQESSVRHIGPMAQDFHAAFGLGEDARRISTIDADGVALAAIQGLNQVVKDKDARIETLEKDVAELKKLVETLVQQKTGKQQ